MEGLPVIWILFMVLSIVLNAVSKAKKAQQGNGQNAQGQHQGAQPARPAQQRPQPAQQRPQPAAQPAKPLAQALQAKPLQPAKPHEAKPMEAHMHTPVMGIEGVGTEGEDCCHEYMLDERPDEAAPFLQTAENAASPEAQALLQGVIFSEILGRKHGLPCRRKRA